MAKSYKKRILLLTANPKGTRPLRLQEEEKKIKEGLRLAGYGKVPLSSVEAVRPGDIQQAMLDFKPQIVHFSGHGAGEKGLVFEDEIGNVKMVDGQALADLFSLFEDKVECVLLNACYSDVQAQAITHHIDYVIGTQREIGDKAAIDFAVGFYRALGAGETYDFSFRMGCNAIRLEGSQEYLTPVLLKKNQERPTLQDAGTPSVQQTEPLAPQTEPSGLKVVLIYKRRAQPDEQLLGVLEKHLTEAGHTVFIDKHMKIGDEWEKEIDKKIKYADAVVVLLSHASIYSEMLAHELERAYKTSQEHGGKPRIFPVRINFEGSLPEDSLPQELANMLSSIQYTVWQGPQDDMSLVNQLLERLKVKETIAPLEMVGGAMPLDSKFYIERPVDNKLHTAISRRDSVVLLKGARQVGKTSLLARGLQRAREANVTVVLTDFQKLSDTIFQSLETFFHAIGGIIADQLDIEVTAVPTLIFDEAIT